MFLQPRCAARQITWTAWFQPGLDRSHMNPRWRRDANRHALENDVRTARLGVVAHGDARAETGRIDERDVGEVEHGAETKRRNGRGSTPAEVHPRAASNDRTCKDRRAGRDTVDVAKRRRPWCDVQPLAGATFFVSCLSVSLPAVRPTMAGPRVPGQGQWMELGW